MAFEKITDMYYVVDNHADLANIATPKMGAEALVITEACEYKCTSTGEWVKQIPVIDMPVAPGVDLTGYATEAYVDEKIAEIEHPTVDLEGFATEEYVDAAIAAIDPINHDYTPEHAFGLMVDSSDNKTLIEAMLEKGKGMYNFHVEKGCPGQPEEVVAKNSSCRGIACIDTYRSDANWYGWIIMFDHDGELYTQYIRNAKPTGWKHVCDGKIAEELHLERYEFSALPEGSIVDRRDKEIRIYCPADAVYTKQEPGEGGNANMYYMTFTTYAPEGAAYMKEGDRGEIVDEIIYFDGTHGTGTDKYGRKFKHHWFALAMYDEATDTWTYFGKNSNIAKYIGWTYVVEWYNADGKLIDMDKIRINLSNADCHLSLDPYYG